MSTITQGVNVGHVSQSTASPRHAPRPSGSFVHIKKARHRKSDALLLAGAEGLEVASQPLLRCPKLLCGLERRAISTATPTLAPFIRHRRRSQALPGTLRVPRVHLYISKKQGIAKAMPCFLAGAEGLEPSARGFGDRCSTN